MSDYGVYALFRPDGHICYIGKGRQGRPREHFKAPQRHRNKHLGRIIINAGGELHVEWLAWGLSEADALAAEVQMIANVGREPCGPLVNLTDGGDGVSGLQCRPETRAVLAEKARGRKQSPETIEKRMQKIRGRKQKPRSPEWGAAHAEKLRGRKASDETRAKQSAALMGRAHSPETREKIGARHRGRVHSAEGRANMSAAHMGQKQSAETIEKRSKSLTASWKNEARRTAMRARMRALWQDPDYREKTLAARAAKREGSS